MPTYRIAYRLNTKGCKSSPIANKARIMTRLVRGRMSADLRYPNVTIDAASPAAAYRRLCEIVLPLDPRPISGRTFVKHLVVNHGTPRSLVANRNLTGVV